MVYSYFDAFIDDDDNIISAFAQAELVLIYFSALAAYTSQVADERRATYSGVGFSAEIKFKFLSSAT